MPRNTTPNKKLLAALISGAFALAACGGGGGGAAATSTITGTAATGMPLAGATVDAYSTTGLCASATTGAQGQFSVDVSTCSGDIILGIQAGTNHYYSMVTASEAASGSTVNVTPWTTAILSGVLGTGLTPQQMAQALDATKEQQVAAADSGLEQTLNTLGVAGLSHFDPMHGAFTANGSGFDAVLDHTTISNATIVVDTGNGTTQSMTIGSDGTVPTPTQASVPPTGSQQNVSYLDINAWQAADGSTTTVNATDSAAANANGQGGNQAFPATPIGTTGQSTPYLYTTTADNLALNYSWGPGSIYFVDSYSSNPQNPYMGGVEMVCQQVAGDGISGTASPTSGIGPQGGTYTNLKSTDVLVTSQATPLTQASALAGLSFNSYYEDCAQGDTLPATVNSASTTYNELQFDAQGNLSATTTNGGTSAPQTLTLTAAQVTAMLQGQPQTATTTTAGVNSYITLNAYRFTSAYGAAKTVIVEHGGAGTSASQLSRGYVGVWANGN